MITKKCIGNLFWLLIKLSRRNYGFKIQASVTYVDGSLGINHDNDLSTDVVYNDELLFRLITTISF